MAGFGSVGLVQSAIGYLLDQRSLVLYKQVTPDEIDTALKNLSADATQAAKDAARAAAEKPEEIFTGFGVPLVDYVTNAQIYGVSYMDAAVDITSDLCEHPTETGTMITDAAIVNPISMKIRVALPTLFYTRIYQEMERFFVNKVKIQAQTKLGVYKNLVLQNMPYEEETNTIDRVVITLELKQVLEVNPQYTQETIKKSTSKAASDADTTTVGRRTDSIDLGSVEDAIANDLVNDNGSLQLNSKSSADNWWTRIFGGSAKSSGLSGLSGLF